MKSNIISKVILAALLPATILCSCEKGQNPTVKPDAPKINTASGVVVEMENATMTQVEDQGSSGRVFVVPVKLTGAEPNGVVRVQFQVEGTGSNKAVEFVLPEGGSSTEAHGDYIITSKTINIPAGDIDGTIGCELATIANDEENEDKELTVTIYSAEGAEINHSKDSTVVTLIDNDKPAEWISLGYGEFMDGFFTGNVVDTEVQIMNHPAYTYIRIPYVWQDVIDSEPSAATQNGLEADASTAENPNLDMDGPNGFLFDVTDPEHVMVPFFYTGLYWGYYSSDLYMQSLYSFYITENGLSLEEAMAKEPGVNIVFVSGIQISIPEGSMLIYMPGMDPNQFYGYGGESYLNMPTASRAPQHTGQFTRPSDILKAQEKVKAENSVFKIHPNTLPRP